jgi:hypothetical protein
MKHLLLCLGAFAVIVFLAIFNLRVFFGGNEDAWLCENGAWVKHGQPLTLEPIGLCGGEKPVFNNFMRAKRATSADEIFSEIRLNYPEANMIVSTPLKIEGEARGSWFFEGSFPIKLIGEDGGVIAQGIAEAESDWMSDDFVHFKADLSFNSGASVIGMLILQNDNPSGLPEYDKQFGVPVRFKPAEKMSLKIFFGNSDLNPEAINCGLVYSLERKVNKTKLTARAALEELLAGPTEAEKSRGYYSSINSGVKINSLNIIDGVAKIDFDEQMNFQMGGSCRVAAIRAQIEQTLKQFSTVESVVISVAGNADEALQP